ARKALDDKAADFGPPFFCLAAGHFLFFFATAFVFSVGFFLTACLLAVFFFTTFFFAAFLVADLGFDAGACAAAARFASISSRCAVNRSSSACWAAMRSA